MTEDTYRRLTGALLSAGMGLAYGVVSQTINRINAPGIPFYQPPLGAALNIVLFTAVLGLIGLISAWPSSSVWGISLSTLVAGIIVQASALTTRAQETTAEIATVLVTVFLFLPIAALCAIGTGVLRLVVNRQIVARADAMPVPRLMVAPLALLVVMASLGFISLIPPDGIAVLSRMDAIVQDGLHASDIAGVPRPLRPPDVERFSERARAGYTLGWQKSNLDRLKVPYRPGAESTRSAALIDFADGTRIVCMFRVVDDDDPLCTDY